LSWSCKSGLELVAMRLTEGDALPDWDWVALCRVAHCSCNRVCSRHFWHLPQGSAAVRRADSATPGRRAGGVNDPSPTYRGMGVCCAGCSCVNRAWYGHVVREGAGALAGTPPYGELGQRTLSRRALIGSIGDSAARIMIQRFRLGPSCIRTRLDQRVICVCTQLYATASLIGRKRRHAANCRAAGPRRASSVAATALGAPPRPAPQRPAAGLAPVGSPAAAAAAGPAPRGQRRGDRGAGRRGPAERRGRGQGGRALDQPACHLCSFHAGEDLARGSALAAASVAPASGAVARAARAGSQ
jgi:hypothetical protein